MMKGTKKKRKTGMKNKIGKRNYAIGSVLASARFVMGSGKRVSMYLTPTQYKDILQAVKLIEGVYDGLAAKYFNSSVKK